MQAFNTLTHIRRRDGQIASETRREEETIQYVDGILYLHDFSDSHREAENLKTQLQLIQPLLGHSFVNYTFFILNKLMTKDSKRKGSLEEIWYQFFHRQPVLLWENGSQSCNPLTIVKEVLATDNPRSMVRLMNELSGKKKLSETSIGEQYIKEIKGKLKQTMRDRSNAAGKKDGFLGGLFSKPTEYVLSPYEDALTKELRDFEQCEFPKDRNCCCELCKAIV
jgi:hypothetical protein